MFSGGGVVNEPTDERSSTNTVTSDEMTDAFRPRRRLLYRRLWRAHCCPESEKTKVSAEDVEDVRQQKTLVRQLTKILTSSQLDTLARIVERRTYHYVQVFDHHRRGDATGQGS